MTINAIPSAHSAGMLAAALTVALFGSWTACSMSAVGTSVATRTRRIAWTIATGAAGGITVYSTHFLALLSSGDMRSAEFDPAVSAQACLLGILGFVIAAYIRNRTPGRTADVVAGLFSGGAIAMMHYLAMDGLVGMGTMQYRVPLASASVLSGTGLCILSSIHLGRYGRHTRAASSLLLASAVMVTHFGAMAAMMPMAGTPAGNAAGLDGSSMLAMTAGGVAVLLAMGLVRERMVEARDAREAERVGSMAEMALEAIVVADPKGVVVDANSRAHAMLDLGNPGGLPVLMPEAWAAVQRGDGRIDIDLGTRDGHIRAEMHLHETTHLRRPVVTVVIRDLTERVLAERRIAHLATHDPLTDLPNRSHLLDRLGDALARSRRTGAPTALLYLDLDGFKGVNDTHGHARGDDVLRQVADILQSVSRETDTVARLGGDEFAIVQDGADQPMAAEALARRIVASVADAFSPETSDVSVGISIGIALSAGREDGPDRLLGDADVALYRAKGDGRGVWRFHEPEMDRELRNRRHLEEELRRAIPRGQMSLAYQPQFDMRTGCITGFEAFARWTHPEMGEIPPSTFIAAAEASGYMLTLGAWLIEEACSEAATWRDDLQVAVNLSALQLAQRSLPARIGEILARTGLASGRLELEIPEAWLSSDPRLVADRLERLRAIGAIVAIGDFGAGRALPAVRGMPFDKVKIGRGALGDLADDRRGAAVLRALIDLGRGLDLTVVAEGIETQNHLDLVAGQDSVGIQGHLLGRPAPIEAFAHIVRPTGAEARAVGRDIAA